MANLLLQLLRIMETLSLHAMATYLHRGVYSIWTLFVHPQTFKLTIAGGAEAHVLASELAAADVGVITIPSRPFPEIWEKRRM